MKTICKFSILVIIFFAAGLIAHAQEGIHFEQDTSWQQTLAKAKAQHKNIFVDCYATWCGPCKQMDETVYPEKEAGEAYNRQFISVRLQMDRTNKDSVRIQRWYKTANRFAKDYNINAYPTLLFFNEDGKPIHKEVGGLNMKSFIRLAADSRNPEKQYYHVLKDFKPGMLDTAEEKGLARSFLYTDKQLAGQIAADYLRRITKSQLTREDNGLLMYQFRETPAVLAIVIRYIKGLNRVEFVKNVNFILSLRDQPEIRKIALNYIYHIDTKYYNEPGNQSLLLRFGDDTLVQNLVKRYLYQLPEAQLLTQQTAELMIAFTSKTTDRGFEICYTHVRQIDSIFHDPYYAQKCVRGVLYDQFMLPQLNTAKASGLTPDFEEIKANIKVKYKTTYADWVTLSGKLAWYNYQIKQKNHQQYWPALIDTHVTLIERFGFDTLTTPSGLQELNNACYDELFLHNEDTVQLSKGIYWMKRVVNLVRKSSDFMFYMDTYACLLYKAGRADEAIDAEGQLLRFCMDNRKLGTYTTMMHTTQAIRDMWKGKTIWEMKEYQQ